MTLLVSHMFAYYLYICDFGIPLKFLLGLFKI